MCVLAVILQFAPLHNPATQSLPRLLELGGGYSLVWTRHGQAKTHSILHEIIEGLEHETRSLVILPTMVPQDQRSLVSLSPPSGIAITLPSERAPAGGDEFIQSAKIATQRENNALFLDLLQSPYRNLVWYGIQQVPQPPQEFSPVKFGVEEHSICGERGDKILHPVAQIPLHTRRERIGELVLVKIDHCGSTAHGRVSQGNIVRKIQHVRGEDHVRTPFSRRMVGRTGQRQSSSVHTPFPVSPGKRVKVYPMARVLTKALYELPMGTTERRCHSPHIER